MEKLIRTIVRVLPLVIVVLLASVSPAVASPPETMPVWRIQIFFETFNTPDAGSDDSVRVELNPNNGTWVDSPLDDWEIGSRTYDLRLDGISKVSDIDYLRVSKTGSGGWCIGRIRLIVNGVAIYDEQFPSGHWLDNCCGHSTVYFIEDYFMRQRAEWVNYVAPVRPDIVPVGHMRSRIQCLFGDFLTGPTALGFRNSNPISIATLDSNSWRVNVDLDDASWVWFPDVDVDFDLTVAWMGSGIFLRPDFRVENLNVNGTSWPGGDEESARTFMINDFRPRLNEMMKAFSYRVGTGFQLAPNGDLHFLPLVITPTPIDFMTISAPSEGSEAPAIEVPDEKRPPLGFRVRTGGEIEASDEMAFVVTLSSGFSEDSDVDLTFSLPAETLLVSPTIETNDGGEKRWLSPQIETRDDGTTLVTLRDRIAAGKDTHYDLRLVFRPGEEKVARIITRAVPVTRELAAEVRALEATTSFRFNSRLVSPEGTICR